MLERTYQCWEHSKFVQFIMLNVLEKNCRTDLLDSLVPSFYCLFYLFIVIMFKFSFFGWVFVAVAERGLDEGLLYCSVCTSSWMVLVNVSKFSNGECLQLCSKFCREKMPPAFLCPQLMGLRILLPHWTIYNIVFMVLW